MRINSKKIMLFGFIGLLGMSISCLKNEIEPDPNRQPESMTELITSETFSFTTSNEIYLKISSPELQGQPASKIEIFRSNPADGAKCIQSGISNIDQEFETSLIIPSYLQNLYIRRTSYDGNTEVSIIAVSGSSIEYSFASVQKKSIQFPDESAPGCSDCSSTISNNQSGNLNINTGETVCILSGGSFTGNLKMNGGTLSVCGTLSPRNINGDGTIIINEEGNFTVTNLNISSKDLSIINYSNAFFVSGNNLNNGGTFINYATISLNQFNNNDNGVFENFGTVNMGGSFNNNSIVSNNGFMNIGGNYANNGSAATENYCRITVGGNFSNNSLTSNYSYIAIGGGLSVNGGGDLDLYNQSLIITNDLTVNDNITGHGTNFSKIVVKDETRVNGGGTLSGSLDLCDANGIEANTGVIDVSITNCETSIPATYCNPGSAGNGNSTNPDSDEDGVSDTFDDYPEDPTRAFNNYYPAEDEYGTLVFEDLWPHKGDHDFNDMVVSYNMNQVSNAEDNIVELFIKIKVKAIGAGFFNGFGMELGVDPDEVSMVTGDFILNRNLISLDENNLESAQEKAVVIFFENAFDALPHPGGGTGVNTTPGLPWVAPQVLSYHLLFTHPITEENLGMPPYNPFIFVDQERGREIHLKNYAPTNLVNMSYFGTGDDHSNPDNGRYYTTSGNLPWAMNIVGDFEYPKEKTDIVKAYNYFDEWVESNGLSHSDWFLDLSGNKNQDFIYYK